MFRTGIFLLTFLLNSVFPLNVNAATKAIRLGRLWDGQRVIANATEQAFGAPPTARV